MTFYQLCTASPAACQALQTCIDIHARQGKAYEFQNCEMPAGCTPERTALGFLRQGESYTLYWRPMVTYLGKSPVLAVLFGRNVCYSLCGGRWRQAVRPSGAVPCPARSGG